MIFDTHVHYDDHAYDEDREELLAALPENGVTKVVNIGASYETTMEAQRLAEKYDFIYFAAGIHPSEVDEYEKRKADMKWLREMAQKDKCVAVGEIGLDYYWDDVAPSVQKVWFREQLEVAKDLGKPIVIHSRDAAQDTYDIMEEMGGTELNAVVHCFSYEVEMAKRFLNLGYYIGLGGVLTYKNGRKQKEVMEMIPLDRLLLETDCPYLPPTPHRGERNSSLYLPFVVEEMARIKGISTTEIEEITYKNAMEFYRIKE